jgi:hypothetical protein
MYALCVLLDGLAERPRSGVLAALAVGLAPISKWSTLSPAMARGEPNGDRILQNGDPHFVEELEQTV